MEETITPAIRICDVHKRYGQHEVLQGIDMDVMPKEVVCLTGPSGSGKTHLLKPHWKAEADEAIERFDLRIYGDFWPGFRAAA